MASKPRSYSQLDQVRRCGHAYKLARVDRVPRRPSCPQVGGTLVHNVSEHVDHALHSGEATTHESLMALGADWASKLWPEVEAEFTKDFQPEDWKVFGKQTIPWWLEIGVPNSLDAYITWRLSKPTWRLAEVPNFGPAIEVPFQLALPSVQVNGWIDRVFQVEGHDGYYPLDLKSGKKPETDEQLAVYGQALETGLGWPRSYGFYLYDLKSGTAKTAGPCDLRHWTAEQLNDVYAKADRLIEAGLFIPKPGDGCFVCDVSDSCVFKQASI